MLQVEDQHIVVDVLLFDGEELVAGCEALVDVDCHGRVWVRQPPVDARPCSMNDRPDKVVTLRIGCAWDLPDKVNWSFLNEQDVESGDQPTDLGSALLSSRMVGVYRA